MEFFPIEEINAYNRNWKIKARVSARGPTRTFNRPNGGSGSVFSVDLIDQKGGEIRGNFFNEAAQKFDFLKIGSVYTFAKGGAKVANKKFSTLKHNFELTFEDHSVIEEVADDTQISHIKMSFIQLRKLKDMTLPTNVDLCVTVLSQQEAKEIQPKANADGKPRGPIFLRRCVVADSSEHSIEVAIWDKTLDSTSLEGKVVCLKSVRVNDYNGFSASVGVENVKIDFDAPQVAECARWAEEQRSSGRAVSSMTDGSGRGDSNLGPIMEGTLADLKEQSEKLQVDGQILFNTTGYFSFLRTTNKEGQAIRMTYDACSVCQKKVGGDSFCMKCNQQVQSKARFMISSMKLEDHTADLWAGTFDEGQKLLGMPAATVAGFEQDNEKMKSICQPLYYNQEFRLRMKAKVESYNGEARTRMTLNGADPVNEREQGSKKLASIGSMYGSASAGTRQAIQEMLACLKGNSCASTEWQQPLAQLTAVCA